MLPGHRQTTMGGSDGTWTWTTDDAQMVLTDDERETLERWARRPEERATRLALRCRIVLGCAGGVTEQGQVAGRARRARDHGERRGALRFVDRRLDGFHDEPRPGTPRTISDDDVERVIVKTLRGAARRATHWSTSSMAKATGMSQSAVTRRSGGPSGSSRIWSTTFKLSPDPQFIDKVRDIVGLYLNPPDAAVVLCVDEKSQIQALDRTAPVLPLLPGVPEPTHPRLPAQRHHQPVRRARCRHGQRDHRPERRAIVPPSSGKFLSPDRSHRPRRTRRCTSCVDNTSTHKTPADATLAACVTRASPCTSRRPTARG